MKSILTKKITVEEFSGFMISCHISLITFFKSRKPQLNEAKTLSEKLLYDSSLRCETKGKLSGQRLELFDFDT